MSRTSMHWAGRSLVAAATAALLAACANDAPLSPDGRSATPAQLATTESGERSVDLSACPNIQVPEGSELVFRAYAEGVQIYQWSGTEWLPAGPRAVLYADAEKKAVVGTHYAGPRWKSLSGGVVRGAVRVPCPVAPDDVPWLLLDATTEEGAGVFQRTNLIQRVNTDGGTKPLTGGTTVGERREVPYTAEYFFYQAP